MRATRHHEGERKTTKKGDVSVRIGTNDAAVNEVVTAVRGKSYADERFNGDERSWDAGHLPCDDVFSAQKVDRRRCLHPTKPVTSTLLT